MNEKMGAQIATIYEAHNKLLKTWRTEYDEAAILADVKALNKATRQVLKWARENKIGSQRRHP